MKKTNKLFLNLKFILMILIFISVFFITIFLFKNKGINKNLNNTNNQNSYNLNNEELKNFNNSRQRVIVELKDDSLLDIANKKNIEYKNLSKSEIEENKAKIEKKHKKIIKEIKNDFKISDEIINYDSIINGFSFKIKANQIDKLKSNPNVKNVYLSQEFHRPLISHSQKIIGADILTQNTKYKGEGMVVAVIDTGIDYKHQALIIDEEAKSKVKYTKEKIDSLKSEDKSLRGKFYSEKVPYGYNYYDKSENLFDSFGVMHGMHVSGILAANDKKENKFGIAPNAQILSLKVFSDDIQYPTTFTDIWLKALDDAIKLKADVINMSLGTPAGFSYADKKHYPEAEMLKKAKDAGILVVVASGNEGTITDGYYGVGIKPIKEVYDTGQIANPAVDENSFSVASIENTYKYVNKINWMEVHLKPKNTTGKKRPRPVPPVRKEAIINLTVAKKDKASKIISGQIVDLKKGQNLVENQIKGKIVLIEYPGYEESKNYNNLLEQIAGFNPKAVLMYKTKEQTDYLGGRITLTGKIGNITVGIIKQDTYRDIYKAAFEIVPDKYPFQLIIETDLKEEENQNKGKLSEFSSWGPTPDLRMKPEITAVGGNVKSLAEDDSYKNISGTSMASPQVAGAATVLKQYLKTERPNMPYNDPDFIKLLLMNTATPILNKENISYFVRQQGAGKINLDKALQTSLTVKATGTNDNNNDGKLELRQIGEKKFNVVLEIQNYSDQDKNIIISHSAIYEPLDGENRSQKPAILESLKSKNTLNKTIKANSKIIVNFIADYTDSNLELNNFLEGFINIKTDNNQENLSVPFLGFYGDWSKQRAIDAFIIPEKGTEKQKAQFVVNDKNNINSSAFLTSNNAPLPIIDNTIYFSPNSEYFKDVLVRISPLRNMEEIEFSILDYESEKTLRVLGKAYNVRKLTRLKINNSFIPIIESLWDGKINDKLVKPGQKYLYQIKVRLNTKGYGTNNIQTFKYPIIIDNLAPNINDDIKLENLEEDKMKKLKFNVQDNQSGINKISITSVKYIKISKKDKKESNGLDLEKLNQAPGSKKENTEKKIQNTPPSLNIEDIKKLANQFIEKENLGAKKYGKNISIEFVDYENDLNTNTPLLKIEEEGKLIIPIEKVSKTPETDSIIKVYKNGFDTKNLYIEVPFFADRTHVEVLATDYLGNYSQKQIKTGEKENYNSINFMNYELHIKDNAQLFVDENEVKSPLYSTFKNTFKVKIKLTKENKHLSTLKIRKGKSEENIINEGIINSILSKKYNLKINKSEKTIEFEVKNEDLKLDIYTFIKDGKLTDYDSSKVARLSFSYNDLERFKKITISKQNFDFNQDTTSTNVQTGIINVEMIFNTNQVDNKKINKVILIQDNKEIPILITNNYFGIEDGSLKNHYAISSYSINLSLVIEKDSTLKFEYGDDYEVVKPNITNTGHVHNHIHSSSQTELNSIDNSNKKYPAIFLYSPNLLDVLTTTKIKESKVHINGFVGYINKEDEIAALLISKVDHSGNIIDKPIFIDGKNLLKDENITYSHLNKNLYSGIGYRFNLDLELKDFNSNIKITALTKNKLEASIVRRVFFDKYTPNLSYKVLDRDLNSDIAKIKVIAQDNSLSLSIFHNDSLVEKIDKTTIGFEKPGIEIEKEITFNLKPGLNEIRLSAKDLANYVVNKTIYIFKSFDDKKDINNINLIETKDINVKEENTQDDMLNKEIKELKFNQKEAISFDGNNKEEEHHHHHHHHH